MEDLPTLELDVSEGCTSCIRAERVVRACERLQSLVRLTVLRLGDPGLETPPQVFGGPTFVFRGVLVGLGTPDCAKLAHRIEEMVGETAGR